MKDYHFCRTGQEKAYRANIIPVKRKTVHRTSFLEAKQLSSSFSSLRSVITWLLVPATTVRGGITHQFQTTACIAGAEQTLMSAISACVCYGWRWQ